MSVKPFIVIRCPRCGQWTYAKSSQKTRFCSRCQKSFQIDPLRVIYVENHQKARIMVQLKNEKDGLKQLKK
jgi:NADH pyrophosphatase NudC (nudix superfamily)